MKRFITLFTTFLVALSLSAQTKAPISFLGIPVDGTKANMVKAIEDKGFEHIKTRSGEDVLIGDFNGTKSNIYVHTTRNKVDRVMVAYAEPVSESQIKIHYNNLLKQFQNNSKYMELVDNELIPEDEDIDYEISVHKKQYNASFIPNLTEEERLEIAVATKDMDHDDTTQYIYKMIMEKANGVVWFTISKNSGYDKFEICIFYDNTLNQAHGEDL